MPRHQQKCNLNAAELGTDVLFVSSKNPGTPRQQWSFFFDRFFDISTGECHTGSLNQRVLDQHLQSSYFTSPHKRKR